MSKTTLEDFDQTSECETIEWEPTNENRLLIKTAEETIDLLISEQFKRPADLITAITDWAPNPRSNENNANFDCDLSAKEIRNSSYKLNLNEVSFRSILNEDKEYKGESPTEEKQPEIKTATEKAVTIIEFCKTNGYEDVVKKAEEKAWQQAKQKQEEIKQEKQRKQRAKEELQSPAKEKHGWKLLSDLKGAAAAYIGIMWSRPTVVALFEDSEYVRIRAYRLDTWTEISHNKTGTEAGDILYNADSSATGRTPETLTDGFLELDDFLKWNSVTEKLPENTEITDLEDVKSSNLNI